jgi:glycosyltransferase involved in cell wall biosynthesis
LGVASTWAARKGLHDFIKLASIIPSDWRIVLVGLSQKQIKGLPANIIGIQRTENVQQLASLYSTANVFINPTWEDTFPTTNLESLACGTPVITYRTGGSVESVSEDTGFIVDKGDLSGVIKCIKEVIKNGSEYYFLRCRNRAVDLYDKNNSFLNYIKLYNRLLNKEGEESSYFG